MAQSYRDYMDIGSDLMLSGDFNKAIEMFDKALEANSKVLPYLWQRGIAYYFAERYEEGIAQFEVDMTVNGADIEESVWRFLCIARTRGFDKAVETISVPTGVDRRVPLQQVYELFAGKGSIEDIHKEINKIPDSELKRRHNFYGYYYIGLYYEAKQDIEKAIENIETALTFGTDARISNMVEVARVNLQQLTKRL